MPKSAVDESLFGSSSGRKMGATVAKDTSDGLVISRSELANIKKMGVIETYTQKQARAEKIRLEREAKMQKAQLRKKRMIEKEAEAKKRTRYYDGRSPWKVTPFALETFGRLGRTALANLRKLARTQAQRLMEGADEAANTLALRWGCRARAAAVPAGAGAGGRAPGRRLGGERRRHGRARRCRGRR